MAETKQFKITVLLGVKDAEATLKRAVDSLLQQSIGFREHIQVVFLEMGSSDSSSMLIKDYAQKNPENMQVLSLGPVSYPEAWEMGKAYAKGDFINCMTAEDSMDAGLLKKAYRFLKENQDILDVVTFKSRFSDSQEEEEFFTSNGNQPKIYDLAVNYAVLPLSICAALVKRDVFNRIAFSKTNTYYYREEAVLRACLDKQKFGYITDCRFIYHTRFINNFTHIATYYKEWYFSAVDDFYLPLLEDAQSLKGHVPPYIQFAVLHSLQWAFIANINLRNKNLLIDEDLQAYIARLTKLFQFIDDYMLLNRDRKASNKFNDQLNRIFYQWKHGLQQSGQEYVFGKNNVYAVLGGVMLGALRSQPIHIQNMEFDGQAIQMDIAMDQLFEPDKLRIFAKLNEQEIECVPTIRYSITKYFGQASYKRSTFHVTVPMDFNSPRQVLTFYSTLGNMTVKLPLSFLDPQSKLVKAPRYTYWHFANLMAYHRANTITIIPAKLRRLFKREMLLWTSLLTRYGKSGRRGLRLRMAYWFTRPFYKNKKIWLTFDKFFKGGDNGEYFYRYAAKQKDGIYKAYILNKDSADYRRLKKEGFHPVANGSLKHKLLFLNADIVLETHASIYFLNDFTAPIGKYFRDLFRFKNVCLQHGLTVQKLALSMNRVHDNLKRYYCASRYEIENLKHPIYGYTGYEDALKLTGVARYDGLVNRDQKEILITPTWRMGLALPRTDRMAPPPYNPAFKESTYYKVYAQLISDERLIQTAKETGYRITYLLHPTVSIQLEDYDNSGYVNVVSATAETNYEKVLSEASLMVTDYSGVQFDFAYMRKPVVYYHHTDIPPHYDEGCFFYETMGFGEICTNHQQMVDTLIEYMKNNCALKDEYRARIDDFFAFEDHNNCQRIYDDVLELQREIDQEKK